MSSAAAQMKNAPQLKHASTNNVPILARTHSAGRMPSAAPTTITRHAVIAQMVIVAIHWCAVKDQNAHATTNVLSIWLVRMNVAKIHAIAVWAPSVVLTIIAHNVGVHLAIAAIRWLAVYSKNLRWLHNVPWTRTVPANWPASMVNVRIRAR